LALTLSEREEISRGIAARRSARSMARSLGHSASTVSREISRNGGYDRCCLSFQRSGWPAIEEYAETANDDTSQVGGGKS
jgi:IS30 family transposase